MGGEGAKKGETPTSTKKSGSENVDLDTDFFLPGVPKIEGKGRVSLWSEFSLLSRANVEAARLVQSKKSLFLLCRFLKNKKEGLDCAHLKCRICII